MIFYCDEGTAGYSLYMKCKVCYVLSSDKNHFVGLLINYYCALYFCGASCSVLSRLTNFFGLPRTGLEISVQNIFVFTSSSGILLYPSAS